MLYPLTFEPILKERVWGGRNLELLYHKKLPSHSPIGESWEISDRPEDVSVINNGPLAGKSLRWVMQNCGVELLGPCRPMPERFPLLVKIIDAQATLSLQVHPPAAAAAKLGGEPKTEMWYVTQADPGSELLVGLKKGVTQGEFEAKIGAQKVADCFHRIAVKPGDAMFLPSGRVHALGAGTVIFEVQQNSDTTYRVFDWNRQDASGRLRDLHVPQSLACIDFGDFEPALLPEDCCLAEGGRMRSLIRHELFDICVRAVEQRDPFLLPGGQMRILGLIEGELRVADPEQSILLRPGQFCLLPACAPSVVLQAEGPAKFLQIDRPSGRPN